MVDAAYYRELLRPVFEGRKVIVGVDVLQGAMGTLSFLHDVGAELPLVIAGARGTGPEPRAEEADVFVLGTSGDTVMTAIRAFESALDDLPPDAVEALDAYDPENDAIFLGSLFTRQGSLAQRQQYGGRRPEWEAIEDKTVVDGIFESAGIERAKSDVVPVATAREAGLEMDEGTGTAWAGDAREGWWGGAEYLRWVRTDDDAREAESFFAAHCDNVRVMPFLEGIPCSIHGVVFPDIVIAFRPVEMITLRRVGSNRLMYAGLATYWDPPAADREVMRDAARRLGVVLRERFDYRGTFTLDGVLTADGFRPTELNPRPGAGLGPQLAASGVHLGMLNKMLIEGADADYRPAELEDLVVSSADATRGGACYTVIPRRRTETKTHVIAKRDGAYSVLAEDEPGDGLLVLGPAAVGSLVRYEPDVTKLVPGAPFGPVAAGVFSFTDAAFDTGFGPLEAARDVRR